MDDKLEKIVGNIFFDARWNRQDPSGIEKAMEEATQAIANLVLDERKDELELVKIKSGYYKKRSHYVQNIYLPLDYLYTRGATLEKLRVK